MGKAPVTPPSLTPALSNTYSDFKRLRTYGPCGGFTAMPSSVKLFHSVAMVCDLSPCYKVFPKLQMRDQTLYSVFYCKGTLQVCVQLKRAPAQKGNFHNLFEKTSTVRIKVSTSVLATDTRHFEIPAHGLNNYIWRLLSAIDFGAN